MSAQVHEYIPYNVGNRMKNGSTEVEEKDFGAFLVDALQTRVRYGMTIKDIAYQCGVNQKTVSNLMYGITRYPRLSTIVVLMEYFGFKLYARKYGKVR